MTSLIAVPLYRNERYIIAILPCGHNRTYHSVQWGWTLPCIPCRKYFHPVRWCPLPVSMP